MITLEFNSQDGFADNIRGIVLHALEDVGGGGFVPTGSMPDDPDLRQFWIEELREGIREDIDCLHHLLDHPEFDSGLIHIPESQAEALLRAAASIRLALRRSALAGIRDSDLEQGTVRPESLSPQTCLMFYTYLFLGGFQEMIVQALDPNTSR